VEKKTRRKAATIQTLRKCLVSITRQIKLDAFSQLDRFNSERLVFLVDWELKGVFITVVQGSYGTPRVHEGLDTVFNVNLLFPTFGRNYVIGYFEGCSSSYNRLFHDYVLSKGKEAKQILDSASESDALDDIKSKVSAVLAPNWERH
jgi:hypothetical protein